MFILFHFTLMLLTLELAIIIADLLNQNPTKKVMLLRKKLFKLGVANGHLPRVLNTIITDKIVMIKLLSPRGHFPLSLSLNDNDSTFQSI